MSNLTVKTPVSSSFLPMKAVDFIEYLRPDDFVDVNIYWWFALSIAFITLIFNSTLFSAQWGLALLMAIHAEAVMLVYIYYKYIRNGGVN
jgi:hypothetical protein